MIEQAPSESSQGRAQRASARWTNSPPDESLVSFFSGVRRVYSSYKLVHQHGLENLEVGNDRFRSEIAVEHHV